MPRQNRVTPHGELIAVPDRGMFLGFRGVLHNGDGKLVRYSSGKAWAICVTDFNSRGARQVTQTAASSPRRRTRSS